MADSSNYHFTESNIDVAGKFSRCPIKIDRQTILPRLPALCIGGEILVQQLPVEYFAQEDSTVRRKEMGIVVAGDGCDVDSESFNSLMTRTRVWVKKSSADDHSCADSPLRLANSGNDGFEAYERLSYPYNLRWCPTREQWRKFILSERICCHFSGECMLVTEKVALRDGSNLVAILMCIGSPIAEEISDTLRANYSGVDFICYEAGALNKDLLCESGFELVDDHAQLIAVDMDDRFMPKEVAIPLF